MPYISWFDLFLAAIAEMLTKNVVVLVDLKTPKSPFEINWPLAISSADCSQLSDWKRTWKGCLLPERKKNNKVHIFWEGHKILRNRHLTFDWHYIHRTKVRLRFYKILWPSQNIWTLMIITSSMILFINFTFYYWLQSFMFWTFLTFWPKIWTI